MFDVTRDWTLDQHGLGPFSENVFAQDMLDLSPPLARSGRRADTDGLLSPFLELYDQDPVFDSTSQSLLHANKAHLANRYHDHLILCLLLFHMYTQYLHADPIEWFQELPST